MVFFCTTLYIAVISIRGMGGTPFFPKTYPWSMCRSVSSKFVLHCTYLILLSKSKEENYAKKMTKSDFINSFQFMNICLCKTTIFHLYNLYKIAKNGRLWNKCTFFHIYWALIKNCCYLLPVGGTYQIFNFENVYFTWGILFFPFFICCSLSYGFTVPCIIIFVSYLQKVRNYIKARTFIYIEMYDSNVWNVNIKVLPKLIVENFITYFDEIL